MVEGPLSEKDTCQVRWREGNYLPAMVLDRRPKDRKRKNEPLSMEQYEYYVHYLHQDRRLDEWVALDRFQLETLRRTSVTATAEPAPSDGPTRRRSSASHGTVVDDNVSSILSGGNWHRTNDPAMASFEREHEETTKVKNIESIVMGEYRMDAWYYSPFPKDYHGVKTLHVCQNCLAYFRKASNLAKHSQTCKHHHPPGKLIYDQPLTEEGQNDKLRVYEIDGSQHKLYCQYLCLLAKLFLDHKTLYFDVNLFMFYVVCRAGPLNTQVVGYFSKEKHSEMGYNLACILTFPQFQKSGFGKFIISCSYELSKREGITGSPEKPLSDLGKLSYRSYWKHVLLHELKRQDPKEQTSLEVLSKNTGIKTEDILSTLHGLEMIEVWKGQHVIHVKQSKISEMLSKERPIRLCLSKFLTWAPPEKSEKSKK